MTNIPDLVRKLMDEDLEQMEKAKSLLPEAIQQYAEELRKVDGIEDIYFGLNGRYADVVVVVRDGIVFSSVVEPVVEIKLRLGKKYERSGMEINVRFYTGPGNPSVCDFYHNHDLRILPVQ